MKRKLTVLMCVLALSTSLVGCSFSSGFNTEKGKTGTVSVKESNGHLELNHTKYDFPTSKKISTGTIADPFSMSYGNIADSDEKGLGMVLDGFYEHTIDENNMADLSQRLYQKIHKGSDQLDFSGQVMVADNLYFVRLLLVGGKGTIIGVKNTTKFAYVTELDGTNGFMQTYLKDAIMQLGSKSDYDYLLRATGPINNMDIVDVHAEEKVQDNSTSEIAETDWATCSQDADGTIHIIPKPESIGLGIDDKVLDGNKSLNDFCDEADKMLESGRTINREQLRALIEGICISSENFSNVTIENRGSTVALLASFVNEFNDNSMSIFEVSNVPSDNTTYYIKVNTSGVTKNIKIDLKNLQCWIGDTLYESSMWDDHTLAVWLTVYQVMAEGNTNIDDQLTPTDSNSDYGNNSDYNNNSNYDNYAYTEDTSEVSGTPSNLSTTANIYEYDTLSKKYDRPWLTVGEDIPAGTYKVNLISDDGIINVHRGSGDFKKYFEMSGMNKSGYTDEYSDYQPDGSIVTVNDKDQIYLTSIAVRMEKQ